MLPGSLSFELEASIATNEPVTLKEIFLETVTAED